MSIRVATMNAETVEVEVTYAGETAKVRVRPSAITPELEAKVDELGETAGFVELVSRLVASWEVIDETGAELAPNTANLRALPTMFLVAVARAAMEAVTPKAPTA